MNPDTEPLTDAQNAAAELISRLHKSPANSRTIDELAAELCATPQRRGGLQGFCQPYELRRWYRQWRRTEEIAAFYSKSIAVDPESLDENEAPESQQSEQPAAKADASEMSGQMLRFMDQRLMRAELTWKETAIALRAGERAVQRMGAGSGRQDDGLVVDWIAFAVLIETAAGGVRRIVPEVQLKGMRSPKPGQYPYGAARVRSIVAVRKDADPRATAQAVGTMLLLFQGEAAGMRTQTEVANATGCTKANISAKGRRMSKTANTSTLATMRCRDKLKKSA